MSHQACSVSPAWPPRTQPRRPGAQGQPPGLHQAARIDMPTAQADADSRNANKAGWRGLLRAGALGQTRGGRLGGEACGGASGLRRAPRWYAWSPGRWEVSCLPV